jgi:copper chaperone CopZ
MPQKVTNRDDGWKGEATAILKIRGLSDSGQAQRFRRTVAKLDGVLRVDVNYILDSVTVKYDADKPTPTQIKKKLALRNHKPVITCLILEEIEGKMSMSQIESYHRKRCGQEIVRDGERDPVDPLQPRRDSPVRADDMA